MARNVYVGLLMFFCFLFVKPSGADAFVDEEYQARLIKHFEQKGWDISGLLDDPRFELIENISEKFRRAVEIKIESFEDYQRVLNYQKKKNDAPGFIEKHRETLFKAEEVYGIPAETIVGVLGIESGFGLHAGKYNPFSAYVSMYAEDYRTKFALAQLEELLIFADKHQLDVLELKSSYAGAMSYAQFLPWSLNRWFVGNELYNMTNNIYSVANFLAHYKEVTGSLEKAILRYNPSTMYRQAVLALAEDAKNALAPEK